MGGLIVREDATPLESFGFEPWALKSIPKDLRIPFLKDAAKFLAKYHHADKYLEEADKKRHEAYLQRVNQAVQTLISDKFVLEEALSEFNTVPNQRVNLEVRLNESRTTGSKLVETTKQLKRELKDMERKYEASLSENAKEREELTKKRQDEINEIEKLRARLFISKTELERYHSGNGPEREENRKLLTKLRHLQSKNGPYAKSADKFRNLTDSLRRRFDYEAAAIDNLPILHRDIEGEITFGVYKRDAISYPEYELSRKSQDPVNTLAHLFAWKITSEPINATILNKQIEKFEEKKWEILGLLPYELMRSMSRNPILTLNTSRQLGFVSRAFEETLVPYVVPIIGSVNEGLTILRTVPGEKAIRQQYRAVAITRYNLNYITSQENRASLTRKVNLPTTAPVLPILSEFKFPLNIASTSINLPEVSEVPKVNYPLDSEPLSNVRELDIDRGD